MVRQFQKHARPYEIEWKNHSLHVWKLDCRILKGASGRLSGRLDISLFTKEPNRNSILSGRSMHSFSIHVNWPTCQVNNFRKIATKNGVRNFSNKLAEKNRRHEFDHPSLRTLEPFSTLPTTKGTTKRPKFPSSWLVVPFHSVWKHGRLGRICDEPNRKIHNKFANEDVRETLTVRISYSLGVHHWHSRVQTQWTRGWSSEEAVG